MKLKTAIISILTVLLMPAVSLPIKWDTGSIGGNIAIAILCDGGKTYAGNVTPTVSDLDADEDGAVAYYVNDGSLDFDEWCTAPGDDANDGLSPATPMATVQAVLDAYDLEPGDAVRIDTGTYNLSANIEVTEEDGGSSEAPVTFVASPYGVVMDRGSTSSGSYGWYLNWSDYVNITTAVGSKHPDEPQQWMRITNAYHGVHIFLSDDCQISRIHLLDNSFGVFSYSSNQTQIVNCLIYDSDSHGIVLSASDYSSIINNTVVLNGSGGIYFTGGSSYVTLSNNIIWSDVSGMYCLDVQSGIISESDYNLLYATDGAMVGYFDSGHETLSAWQEATGFDLNSLSAGPTFADGDNGDFHVRSAGGSYHDGAWTADGLSSPAVDAGDPATDASGEPLENGGRVNLGAFGGSEQASKAPAGRTLFVREPCGYETVSSASIISWLSSGQGWEAGDTLTLEYSADNGATWTELAASVPAQLASESVVLLSDDVESGGAGWTADAPWAVTDSNAHSATRCWNDSPDGDYAADANAFLTSGSYNIEIYDALTLTFWLRYDSGDAGDFGRVEVSTDDGMTWTEVASINADQADWIQETVDLSSFIGKRTLKVRFRMDSDGDSTVGDGWYVDDIELTGLTRPNTIELDTTALADSPYYRIRITSNEDSRAVAESERWFTVHNGPIVYYVNDASLELDEWCTAAGADETGRGASPDLPAVTVQWIIDTFDLEPGDEVRIDTGVYNLPSNIEVTETDSGSPDAPVAFVASPYGVAMDRGSGALAGSYAWHLNGSDCVAIKTTASSKYPGEAQKWMRVTNAFYGVFLDNANYCQMERIRVFDNDYGIYVNNGSQWLEITNCLIHENGSHGISLRHSYYSRIINNTIVRNGYNGIHFYDGGAYAALSNNIIGSDGSGKYGLYVHSGSIRESDYNLLYTTNGAMVGYLGRGIGTLPEWQEATGFDLNSLSTDPGFVDAENGDFHVQSTGGSYHDGAWTADGLSSPAVDAGDPATDASDEPSENGGRVNLGAFGGSEQASKTPDGRTLFVMEPFN